MKRLALVPLIVLTLLASACSDDPTGPSSGAKGDHESTVVVDGLEFTLSTPQSTFRAGDLVPITMRVENLNNSSMTFRFNSTKQHDLHVEDGGRRVWRWSTDRAFGRALTSFTLKPGESRTWSEDWDQTNDGGQTLAAGDYELVGVLPASQDLRSSAPLTITLRR